MAFLLLQEFTVLSLFLIIKGDILRRTAAATTNQQFTDGGLFLERIVHGDKISQNPGYLVFTAPYKLCKGSCSDNDDNFAMAFPLFIGKRGVKKYQDLYARDHENLYSNKPNLPFKSRPTKKTYTLCPNKVTKKKTPKMTEDFDNPTTETKFTTETDKNSKEIPLSTVFKITTKSKNTAAKIDTSADKDISIPNTFIPTTVIENNLEITTPFSNTLTNKNTDTSLADSKEVENTKISPSPVLSKESEDITFEGHTDEDYTDNSFATNANEIRCPQKKCRKKEVTPSIITLVSNRRENMKLDTRNADWDSYYLDSLDLY